MENLTRLGFLCVVFLSLTLCLETSAKTLNIIDVYRKEVFEIAVLKNRKPVIVYFSRGSCTLCTRLQTKLEKVAKDNSESIYMARVDLDKLPQLKEEFQITSLPTTRAFYKGRMVGEVKGPKYISIQELTNKMLKL